MRLFHLQNEAFQLKQFSSPATRPAYAILSHRWRDGEEILFEDIKHLHSSGNNKSGVQKIRNCEALVRREHGVNAFWIDTCCINKDSSAELQEAINSMYRWYRDAEVCYAYLDDVDAHLNSFDSNVASELESRIRASEWFTRSWTLQELIAPRKVVFYDRNWQFLGTRDDLPHLFSSITGVPIPLLRGETVPSDYSIAQRMSWAAHRRASRVEDESYSMIGLFNVSMSMLYGEDTLAFYRLQEEIIKSTNDQSIFAWEFPERPKSIRDARDKSILAESPRCFASFGDVVPSTDTALSPFRLTNLGLEITLPVSQHSPREHRAMLQCRSTSNPTQAILLNLLEHPSVIMDDQNLSGGRKHVSLRPHIVDRVRRVPRGEMLSNHRSTPLLVHRHRYVSMNPLIIHLKGNHWRLRATNPPDFSVWENESVASTGTGTAKPVRELYIEPPELHSITSFTVCLDLRHRDDWVTLLVARSPSGDELCLESASKHAREPNAASTLMSRFLATHKKRKRLRFIHRMSVSTPSGELISVSLSAKQPFRRYRVYEVSVTELQDYWSPLLPRHLSSILRKMFISSRIATLTTRMYRYIPFLTGMVVMFVHFSIGYLKIIRTLLWIAGLDIHGIRMLARELTRDFFAVCVWLHFVWLAREVVFTVFAVTEDLEKGEPLQYDFISWLTGSPIVCGLYRCLIASLWLFGIWSDLPVPISSSGAQPSHSSFLSPLVDRHRRLGFFQIDLKVERSLKDNRDRTRSYNKSRKIYRPVSIDQTSNMGK